MSIQPLRQALVGLYADLAAEIAVAAPVCELSGRCCRFKEYGHTLFISQPEAELLLEQGLPKDATIDAASCPFQIEGLCTAREKRPLGCRVYYCDPNYTGVGESISERYIARLKQLHHETGTPWDYRPLHHFLENGDAESASLPISK
jgi:Fe-S-cluster containining protein